MRISVPSHGECDQFPSSPRRLRLGIAASRWARRICAPDTTSCCRHPPPTRAPVAQPAICQASARRSARQWPDTNAAPDSAAASSSPRPPRRVSRRAMTSYSAGQYADAVTAFSDFVADFPQDRHREEALYRLAESYRNLGRTDDALAAYTFQVQNYPDGLAARRMPSCSAARFFSTAGKFADAIPPLQFVVG